MADYRLSPAAQRDLDDIWDYTNAQWGHDQANRYLLSIKNACQVLAQAPQHAQAIDHIRQGYRRRSVERHIVYFRITNSGIVIVRILHQHMDAMRHI